MSFHHVTGPNEPMILSPLTPGSASPLARSKTAFWHELISSMASAAGINPDLAVNVAEQESGLDPNAVNPKSGAIGMMQLMPGTAAALGVNPYDAMANIAGGIRYLQEQLSTFGDEAKALAAYNWGPNRVAQAVEQWGTDWLSHAPGETQRYVSRILSRLGGNSTLGLGATTALTGNVSLPVTTGSIPAGPTLAGEISDLSSALDAYLLTEVLG